MALRWYVVPVETLVLGERRLRAPKYFQTRFMGGITSPGFAVPISQMHFDTIDYAIVRADTDDAVHAEILKAGDAISVPTRLARAQATALNNRLGVSSLGQNMSELQTVRLLAQLAQTFQSKQHRTVASVDSQKDEWDGKPIYFARGEL